MHFLYYLGLKAAERKMDMQYECIQMIKILNFPISKHLFKKWVDVKRIEEITIDRLLTYIILALLQIDFIAYNIKLIKPFFT